MAYFTVGIHVESTCKFLCGESYCYILAIPDNNNKKKRFFVDLLGRFVDIY